MAEAEGPAGIRDVRLEERDGTHSLLYAEGIDAKRRTSKRDGARQAGVGQAALQALHRAFGWGSGVAGQLRRDRGAQVLEERVARVAVPAREIDCLEFPETQREGHIVQHHGDQNAAALGVGRLVANEVSPRPYALVRPDDDHTFGGIESALYLMPPALSAGKATIPPHRKPTAFQCSHQSTDPCFILTLVRNEKLAHW
jgi:hypothetical protein